MEAKVEIITRFTPLSLSEKWSWVKEVDVAFKICQIFEIWQIYQQN